MIVTDDGPENGSKMVRKEEAKNNYDFGLGVAEIVITAATPMKEEPEQPFPPPEESTNEAEEFIIDPLTEIPEEEEIVEENKPDIKEELEEEKSIADDQPTDSAPFPNSSSTGSDGDSTGPSTAENSQSLPTKNKDDDILIDDDIPKQVVGGRASIPDELEPHQLAQLQDLKESNA